VLSSVQLAAPVGFVFDPVTSCVVQSLEDSYYATHHGPPTKRLPGISTCVHNFAPFNHALIGLEGSMLADTYYAFGIMVTNPTSYNNTQQDGWRIFTVSGSGHRVDGTPETLQFAALTSTDFGGGRWQMPANVTTQSFGLYQHELNTQEITRVAVSISSMMPFNITYARAKVKVLPLKVPVNVTAPLRIVAPKGFVWDFLNSEMAYKVPGPNATATEALEGITADFPGFPARDGNVLIWDPLTFDASATYGFEAYIRVPNRSPTASVNEFIVEFGYTEGAIEGRFAAGTVPVKQVRSLVNAAVDYSTNVEGKANLLIFEIQTVTEVPTGGIIRIVGPPNFLIDLTCTLLPAYPPRGSPYELAAIAHLSQDLPADTECTSGIDAVSGTGVEIRIRAPTGGIPPGRYRWQIAVTNPPVQTPNPPDPSSPCHHEFCWMFETMKYYSNTAPKLDAKLLIPAFPINQKMVEALLPTLTQQQQASTGRDDRPLHLNPLVFAFKLNTPVLSPSYLRVRGPAGVVFREDCLVDMKTTDKEVFGTDQEFPSSYWNDFPDGYTPFDPGLTVVNCRGEGPDAQLLLDPGISLGMRSETLYAFRLALLKNAPTQPNPNSFSLEFAGESSDPFEGFLLWTFTRTSIHTVSMGRSTPITGATKLRNPVTFTFRPRNTIRGAGMKLIVTAPPAFTIANVLGECRIMMQPVSLDASGVGADLSVPPDPNYLGPPSLLWGDADVDCMVDQTLRNKMVANVLASGRVVTAGRDYQLTVFVNNPGLTVPAGPDNVWYLETEDSIGYTGALPTFRDYGIIPGFPIYERVRQWMYLNEDPQTKIPYANGLTVVPGLYFEFQFNVKLEINDIITIKAPAGFFFMEMADGKCSGFRWEPLKEAYLFLPNSNITCSGDTMRFEVQEPKPIPELRLIKFRADTKNPAKTPHVMLNHWLATHTSVAGEIRGTEASLSWNVIPQLAEVKVMLTGAHRAEGAESSISVSFVPVSDADELQIIARKPTGFDFTGCGSTSLGHEVIQTSVEKVRVRAAMFSNVQTDVVIVRMRLGRIGGLSEFDLVTRLNNGVQMDEMLKFRGGFRQPGRVTIDGTPTLSSSFSQDPEAYPVQSLWPNVRMGEPAVATFEFHLSMMADATFMIRIRAPPYSIEVGNFKIMRISTGDVISAQVLSASAGELVARLGGPLWTFTTYSVRLNVVTPYVPRPEDSMFSIEILDGGALPVNTNDGLQEGFRLLENMGLKVHVGRSPPMAEINCEVRVDPKTVVPTQLRIIAPPGFNFTDDCLVNGGDNGEIVSCRRSTDIASRASAILRTQPGGINVETSYVIIKIVTPDQTGQDRSWFVDGRDNTGLQLGWGHDPLGVQVRQMLGAGVVYPGIPNIAGQMAFRFITNEKVEANGKLRIGYPRSITIQCDGPFLYKVALEGDITCNNFPRLGYFELLMTRPLPPGQQAFAVTSTCPNAVNEANTFFIVVFDPENNVVDAAMNIPGLKIQHGLPVAALEIIYSAVEANRPTTVSMGLELTADLPDLNPPVMFEIVVRVPRDFTQNVERAAQVEMLTNPGLPYSSVPYLNVTYHPMQVHMYLDTNETVLMKPGKFRFAFPVLVPARMPKYNVFLMTVCKPNPPGSEFPGSPWGPFCTGATDDRALFTFPMAGFELGTTHPRAKMFVATAAGWRCRAAAAWLMLPFLLTGALLRP